MNRQTMPTTHAGVLALLGDRHKATLAHNTVAWKYDDETVGVSLHGHLIVLLHDNGAVSVRHAGWPTVTTFDRIKRFAPAGWGVSRANGSPQAFRPTDGVRVPISADQWVTLD